MDRTIFSTERKISRLCIPADNSNEQTNSLKVFWFPSSAKFVFAMLLSGMRVGGQISLLGKDDCFNISVMTPGFLITSIYVFYDV